MYSLDQGFGKALNVNLKPPICDHLQTGGFDHPKKPGLFSGVEGKTIKPATYALNTRVRA